MISIIAPLIIASHEVFRPLERIGVAELKLRCLDKCLFGVCPMIIKRSGKIVVMPKKKWQQIEKEIRNAASTDNRQSH